jgi:hypothetical protein
MIPGPWRIGIERVPSAGQATQRHPAASEEAGIQFPESCRRLRRGSPAWRAVPDPSSSVPRVEGMAGSRAGTRGQHRWCPGGTVVPGSGRGTRLVVPVLDRRLLKGPRSQCSLAATGGGSASRTEPSRWGRPTLPWPLRTAITLHAVSLHLRIGHDGHLGSSREERDSWGPIALSGFASSCAPDPAPPGPPGLPSTRTPAPGSTPWRRRVTARSGPPSSGFPGASEPGPVLYEQRHSAARWLLRRLLGDGWEGRP